MVHLNSLDDFTIYDFLHKLPLASFFRQKDNGEASKIVFWGDCRLDRNRSGNLYQILTTQDVASDKKLKKNIKKSIVSALSKIRKFVFKEFDWNEKSETPGVHIDIGIIAQDAEKIDKNYVEIDRSTHKGKKKEIRYLKTLNLLTTTMKAVQELDETAEKQKKTINKQQNTINKQQKEIDEQKKINDRQQKQIEFLINKLNCKNELEEYLKEGEENG